MDGTRIVMVRHGESVAQERASWAATRVARGCRRGAGPRSRRCATGWRRPESWTARSVLYASVMPRAVETAAILAPVLGDLDVMQDCDLCEHHPGEGDGLPWEEYDERYPHGPDGGWHPDLRRDPGGETWNEMADRVATGIDRLVERHAGHHGGGRLATAA